ncbi:MAG: hypothetical protein JWN34_2001 [Bryobacterales bacterium]|nr:hypothetical protein [Bryobacterales bacterium]
MPQRQHPQLQQDTVIIANKYVMPGLCPEIAHQFRRVKNLIPHARTIAMNAKIGAANIYPALIHVLFERSDAQERRIAALERASEGRVEGLQVIQGRRAA